MAWDRKNTQEAKPQFSSQQVVGNEPPGARFKGVAGSVSPPSAHLAAGREPSSRPHKARDYTQERAGTGTLPCAEEQAGRHNVTSSQGAAGASLAGPLTKADRAVSLFPRHPKLE